MGRLAYGGSPMDGRVIEPDSERDGCWVVRDVDRGCASMPLHPRRAHIDRDGRRTHGGAGTWSGWKWWRSRRRVAVGERRDWRLGWISGRREWSKWAGATRWPGGPKWPRRSCESRSSWTPWPPWASQTWRHAHRWLLVRIRSLVVGSGMVDRSVVDTRVRIRLVAVRGSRSADGL